MKRTLALGLALLLSCGSALAREPAKTSARPPVPLLWKACDADNCIYLLGSFHVLKASDYPLAKDVDEALAKSSRVIFEISPAELQDKNAAAMALFQAGMRTDGTTLDSDLSTALQAKLASWLDTHASMLAKSGLGNAALQRLKPWFVAILITQLEYQAAGMSPEYGLDDRMAKAADLAGKPTAGLETVPEQVRILSGLPLKDQIQMLDESLDESGSTAREINTLHKAWRSGDADVLWKDMGVKLRDRYPDAYRIIDADRNARWLPQLQSMLDTPGQKDALVVVGSLHLLGPDGLVDGLKARGYKVERVCSACMVKRSH